MAVHQYRSTASKRSRQLRTLSLRLPTSKKPWLHNCVSLLIVKLCAAVTKILASQFNLWNSCWIPHIASIQTKSYRPNINITATALYRIILRPVKYYQPVGLGRAVVSYCRQLLWRQGKPHASARQTLWPHGCWTQTVTGTFWTSSALTLRLAAHGGCYNC